MKQTHYPDIKPPSLVLGMSINQFSRLYIMAVIIVIVLTVISISGTPAEVAQNMTQELPVASQATGSQTPPAVVAGSPA
ncbi:MAG TPA: hypothetical protein VLR10_04835 [Nitrososphaeraceae archaeon]|jgi:hypothetical protein|nr:hypothetical protein [Nitrososphaeraceae archaeon]